MRDFFGGENMELTINQKILNDLKKRGAQRVEILKFKNKGIIYQIDYVISQN